jgi:hypothetical protein
MTILTTHNGKYPSSIFPSYELPLWSITGKPKHRTDTRQQLVPRVFLPPHISETRRHAAITNPLHSVKKPAARQKPYRGAKPTTLFPSRSKQQKIIAVMPSHI